MDRKTWLLAVTKSKRNSALLAYVREHPTATSREVAQLFGVTSARVRRLWRTIRRNKVTIP